MNNAFQNSNLSKINSDLNAPGNLESCMELAKLLAESGNAVPSHMRNNFHVCLDVVLQAVTWKMTPYAVARKTYVINGKLCYEAQLIAAAVQISGYVVSGFTFEFFGDWDKHVPTDKRTEAGLAVRCGAILAGYKEVTWGEKIFLSHITTRFSPLWVQHTKQQLAYYATRAWARLYVPAICVGESIDVSSSQSQISQISDAKNSLADDIFGSSAQSGEQKLEALLSTPKTNDLIAALDMPPMLSENKTTFQLMIDKIGQISNEKEYLSARVELINLIENEVITNTDEQKQLVDGLKSSFKRLENIL